MWRVNKYIATDVSLTNNILFPTNNIAVRTGSADVESNDTVNP